MKRDQEIFDIIEREHQRQAKGIELIASENFVSDQVMQAMGSCLTNKYAEGYPGKRYYGGCEVVDESERLAIARIKQLFGAEYANVQPHSGAQANAAVLQAVLNPGDTFMGLNLAHGGHLSHGSAVNSSGILYHAVGYDLNPETGRVDYDKMEQQALVNTMLAQDGLFVYVPRGVKMDRCVQVINILKSPFSGKQTDGGLMVNRRVLIVLEEEAEAKFLFCDHAADDCHFLTTQVIEAFVGDNAKLDLYCMEETHAKNVRVSNVYIDQQRNSRVNHNVITLHNGVTRNKLDLELNGEGAECSCNGCVIADKRQHVDNNTLITHRVPHCTSEQLYKYVLDGEAVGAFAGKVFVAHDAQKTASQMTNQNLCATKTARMYTQPMLEIYADDVKCAHGSTVGQLNDAALFYMQQRGISVKESKLLLEFAFINEVVDKMELIPLRDRLHYLVEQRFRGQLSKCEGCRLCR